MELPYSTPSAAVKYEFGMVDLLLEIAMENILLAVKVLKNGNERISCKLLHSMLEKDVPGFCVDVKRQCSLLDYKLEELVQIEGDIRVLLKK